MKLCEYELYYALCAEDLVLRSIQSKNERTGINTYRFPGTFFRLNRLNQITPILSAKKVMWKSAIEEILWIMQKGSNNINDLRPHIWDEWASPDGSIGKAYGYQIQKYHQVDRLLKTLKDDPSSRRGVLNLWNPGDLDEMNLVPCCFSSVWNIINGELHCMLVQRSGDMMLGVPFNTLQYYALQMMFAKHLGVKVGSMFHTMADCHIYENHTNGVYEYLRRVSLITRLYTNKDVDRVLNITFDDPEFVKILNGNGVFKNQVELQDTQKIVEKFINDGGMDAYPKLTLNTDKTDFWDFTIDDFAMEDYHPMPHIHFDVAV